MLQRNTDNCVIWRAEIASGFLWTWENWFMERRAISRVRNYRLWIGELCTLLSMIFSTMFIHSNLFIQISLNTFECFQIFTLSRCRFSICQSATLIMKTSGAVYFHQLNLPHLWPTWLDEYRQTTFPYLLKFKTTMMMWADDSIQIVFWK